MKNILILLLLFTSCARDVNFTQTKMKYVSTTGDNGDDGSIGSPWRDLSYACSQVAADGGTIFVFDGTYTESARCNLNVGVNIQGESMSGTIINFTYAVNDFESGCIRLYSAALDNTADQSISYLTITGTGFTAYNGITIYNRGNVEVHHCKIKDFYSNGIYLGGPTAILTTPAEDNKIYNCMITDCSKRQSGLGYGSIMIRGQKDLIIHNNNLTNIGRDEGDNGNLINAVRGGYEGLKFYENICTKPNYEGGEWNFHMEMWASQGGCEYYNNVFYGGECAIDIGSAVSESTGHFKNAYDYTHYIHGNIFNNIQKQAAPDADNNRFCITLEDCNVNDIWIERNRFYRTPTPISIEMGTSDYGPYNNIYIYYNLFEDIGYTNNSWAGCLYIKSYGANAVYNDIHFQNNTVVSGPVGKVVAGVLFYFSGTVNGLDITNNIILNSYTAWLLTSNNGIVGEINDLVVRNNILYGNANSNNIDDDDGMIDAGSYVSTGNINEDPEFFTSSNYHLQLTSPGIGAGIDLGLEYDFSGATVDPTNPEIGAYESNLPIVTTSAVSSITSTTATGGGNVTSEGSGIVTSRGVAYGTSPDPDISGDHTFDNTGSGVFVSSLIDLVEGSTYYVRAYATNNIGTAYGDNVVFIASSRIYTTLRKLIRIDNNLIVR